MKYSRSQIVTTVAVMLILFVFPLISIYYLNSGLNFRKSISDELTVKDSLENFEFRLAEENKSVSFENIKGENLYLLLKGSKEIPLSISDTDKFYQAIDQFKNRYDLVILLPSRDYKSERLSGFNSFIKNNEIKAGTVAEPVNVSWPDRLKNQNAVALIDYKGRILHYYSIEDTEIMDRLVEHISVSLPDLNKKRYKTSKD